MEKRMYFVLLITISLILCTNCTGQTVKEIPLDVFKDKIKGGWAGQTISCTYGVVRVHRLLEA